MSAVFEITCSFVFRKRRKRNAWTKSWWKCWATFLVNKRLTWHTCWRKDLGRDQGKKHRHTSDKRLKEWHMPGLKCTYMKKWLLVFFILLHLKSRLLETLLLISTISVCVLIYWQWYFQCSCNLCIKCNKSSLCSECLWRQILVYRAIVYTKQTQVFAICNFYQSLCNQTSRIWRSFSSVNMLVRPDTHLEVDVWSCLLRLNITNNISS